MLGRIARWADAVMHPEWYHGADERPPFFEGWYFKFVSPDERKRYAIIPGIFLSDDPAQHHAFVQVFDGLSGRATYHRYPAEAFSAAPGTFDVCIGNNRFTRRRITLDIDDDLRRVQADLHFGDGQAWPVSVLSPGIMGFFGWLPVMECYHGVLSMDHSVQGRLSDDGETIDFTGGRGYIEKDWGRSFPAGWVWMQTNHFDVPETSLTASIAVTPLMGGWFPGFIVGVWHQGALHQFATYTGAKTDSLELTDEHVFWTMRGSGKRLEIEGRRAETSILPGPNRQSMGTRVPETLRAEITIRLTEIGSGALIFEGTGRCAGLEVAGDIDRLRSAVG